MNPDTFDELHAARADPWDTRSRWYEARKSAIVLALLRSPRYASGFEGGCSIGTLTQQLATRCDHLVAADFSSVALENARRNVSANRVEFIRCDLRKTWPAGRFDLIVLSEVLYFMDEHAVRNAMRQAKAALLPGGEIVLVNWIRSQGGNPLSGVEADRIARDIPELEVLGTYQDADFIARTLARPGTKSVAGQEFDFGDHSPDERERQP